MATLANIDWPSRSGLSDDAQRAEIDACVRLAAESGLNVLLLQVRSVGDAIYPSKLAPWSAVLSGRSGCAPGYDPLAAWMDAAQREGLELHAWINPLRVGHPQMRQTPSALHVTCTHPEWVRAVDNHLWLDPGDTAVRRHVVAVVHELLCAYPLDGLHIDDYFSPYPEIGTTFPDDETFDAAHARGDDYGDRDAWRRANVDALVTSLAHAVHAARPMALFGVSPFGIGRTRDRPAGIKGFDPWAGLHADAEGWWSRGLFDAISPQLYWPRTRPEQSFDVLLDHWASLAPLRGHLWPSLHDSAAMAPEPGWANDEIARRCAPPARGDAQGAMCISASVRSRAERPRSARKWARDATRRPPRRPAQPCGAPRLTGARTAGRFQRQIKVVPGASRRAAVWTRANEAKWQLDVCPIDAAGHATFTLEADPATSLCAVAFAVTGNGLLSDRSEHCW